MGGVGCVKDEYCWLGGWIDGWACFFFGSGFFFFPPWLVRTLIRFSLHVKKETSHRPSITIATADPHLFLALLLPLSFPLLPRPSQFPRNELL